MPDTNKDPLMTMDEFFEYQKKMYELEQKRQETIDRNMKTFAQEGIDAAFLASGWGEQNYQITNNFAKLNRFGTRFVMDNYLRTGYTFITRPELNLTDYNLKQDRIMNLLNTMDPSTIKFAIRAYLDTRFMRKHINAVVHCPYIDYRNPFFTILTNNLVSFSGGPQYTLETATEEPGYFGESQSVVIGSDSYYKPFDLNLEFVDPIGGPIDAIIKFWTRYCELVTQKGVMIMYPDQIGERVLNYTVSIYRFIMDPSFRYIKKWAKYTGCVPVSRPGASVFDYGPGDVYVDSLRKFNIGFRCLSGVVDEDDPIVIEEFNMLVERYFPLIRSLRKSGNGVGTMDRGLVAEGESLDTAITELGLTRNPLLPEFNYTGIPYIVDTPHGLRLDVFSQAYEVDITKAIPAKNTSTGMYETRYTRLEATANALMQSVAKHDQDINQLRFDYAMQKDYSEQSSDSLISASTSELSSSAVSKQTGSRSAINYF